MYTLKMLSDNKWNCAHWNVILCNAHQEDHLCNEQAEDEVLVNCVSVTLQVPGEADRQHGNGLNSCFSTCCSGQI